MKLIKRPVVRVIAIALLCCPIIWNASTAQSTVVMREQIQCSYDPNSGQPNPFGSRAFITVTQSGADTTFRYERFPSLVNLPDKKDAHKPRAVTLERKRTLVFYNTQIEVARELMRMRKDYYYELIGYKDIAGYSTYDEAMSCE